MPKYVHIESKHAANAPSHLQPPNTATAQELRGFGSFHNALKENMDNAELQEFLNQETGFEGLLDNALGGPSR